MVGNGIAEIGAGFSVKVIDTGFSFHSMTISRIDIQQKHTDETKTNIHQNRSLQCRFRSTKYRIP